MGDRDAHGLKDNFLPDGGQHRVFEPLWLHRTWRYLALDIKTADAPLTLESLTAEFTAYPFEEKGTTFTSPDNDPPTNMGYKLADGAVGCAPRDLLWIATLLRAVAVRRRYAHPRAADIFMPWPAMTAWQSEQALEAFDASRFPDGITRSRYRDSLAQTIQPTFSLLWIGMVHDWWNYRPDPKPARGSLPGVRSVLGWFARYEQPDGMLQKLPWWSFVDWVSKGDIPTYDANGESCTTTLPVPSAALEDAATGQRNGLGDPLLAMRDRTEGPRM